MQPLSKRNNPRNDAHRSARGISYGWPGRAREGDLEANMSELPDKSERRCGTCRAYIRATDGVWRCHDPTLITFGHAQHEDGLCNDWRSKPPHEPPPNPYARTIRKWRLRGDVREFVGELEVDVYDIAAAYGLGPATTHALKKLCDRGTGEKSRVQELREAIASIERAIEMEGE